MGLKRSWVKVLVLGPGNMALTVTRASADQVGVRAHRIVWAHPSVTGVLIKGELGHSHADRESAL